MTYLELNFIALPPHEELEIKPLIRLAMSENRVGGGSRPRPLTPRSVLLALRGYLNVLNFESVVPG